MRELEERTDCKSRRKEEVVKPIVDVLNYRM
jgi:hypothetical protein